MARKSETKWTRKLWNKYLKFIRETGLKQAAARSIGIDPTTAMTWRNNKPDLDDEVLEAMDDYRERLEAETHRRAVEGLKTPVFGKEGIIGHKQTYSDILMLAHLKRHIPAYRDKQQIDHTIKGGVLVVPGLAVNSKAWEEEEPDE